MESVPGTAIHAVYAPCIEARARPAPAPAKSRIDRLFGAAPADAGSRGHLVTHLQARLVNFCLNAVHFRRDARRHRHRVVHLLRRGIRFARVRVALLLTEGGWGDVNSRRRLTEPHFPPGQNSLPLVVSTILTGSLPMRLCRSDALVALAMSKGDSILCRRSRWRVSLPAVASPAVRMSDLRCAHRRGGPRGDLHHPLFRRPAGWPGHRRSPDDPESVQDVADRTAWP